MGGRGAQEDVGARARLLHRPACHVDHLVAHRHGLHGVVRHHEHGEAQVGVKRQHQLAHVVAQRLVQGAEGLVHEHRARCGHQRPREGHALALPAGNLVRAALAQACELHFLQHPRGLLATVRASHATHLEGEGHVVEHAHVGEEPRVLEHHRDAAPVGGQVVHRPPVEEHAPGVLHRKAARHAQKRRLARAALAQDGDERAVGHAGAHVAQKRRALGGEADVVEVDAHGRQLLAFVVRGLVHGAQLA